MEHWATLTQIENPTNVIKLTNEKYTFGRGEGAFFIFKYIK